MNSHHMIKVLVCDPKFDDMGWTEIYASSNHSKAYRYFLDAAEVNRGAYFAMVGFTNGGFWEVMCYHGITHEADPPNQNYGRFRFGMLDEDHDALMRECGRLATLYKRPTADSKTGSADND